MMKKSDEEWKKILTKKEYKVMREKGTEIPFTGKLLRNKASGTYHCAACGARLFLSEKKFNSGTGWPSFYDANSKSIGLKEDRTLGIKRTEVVCKKCGSHLGHVFDDSPQTPTGKRFCINSVSLKFRKKQGRK